MTVEDVRERAGVMIGKTISGDYTATLINDAINLLAPLFKTFNNKEIGTYETTNKKIDLPLGVIEVLKVTLNDDKYTDYKVYGQSLYTEEEGEFKLEYLQMPSHVDKETDELTMHQLFRNIIVYYVAAMVLFYEDSGSQKAQLLLERFYNEAAQIDTQLKRSRQKNIIIPARLWR